MPPNPLAGLSASVIEAVRKGLISKNAVMQMALAGTRTPNSAIGRVSQQIVQGPRGEMYMFPSQANMAERSSWDPVRSLINRGMVLPVKSGEVAASLPVSETRSGLQSDLFQAPRPSTRSLGPRLQAKSEDASRLAQTIRESALPQSRSMPVMHESLAMKLNPEGSAAESAASLSGPETTGLKTTGFLHDLAADPRAQGSGYDLLKAVLEGPLYPDVDRLIFTPLTGARDFYKKKFGARLLTPQDSVSDTELAAAMGRMGQHQNVADLGLGIIERKEGGEVKIDNSSSVMDGPTYTDLANKLGNSAVNAGLKALKDPMTLASFATGPLGVAAGLMSSSEAEGAPAQLAHSSMASILSALARKVMTGNAEEQAVAKQAIDALTKKNLTEVPMENLPSIRGAIPTLGLTKPVPRAVSSNPPWQQIPMPGLAALGVR